MDEVETEDNAFEATVTAKGKVKGVDKVVTKHFRICMPDTLNPNQNGGTEPTFAELTNFCTMSKFSFPIIDKKYPIRMTMGKVTKCNFFILDCDA